MKALSFTKLLVCMMLCLCVVLLASCRGGVTVKPDGDGGVTITPNEDPVGGNNGGNENNNNQGNGGSSNVEVHSHTYSLDSTSGAYSCTDGGIKVWRCSCGETFNETVAATGHNIRTYEGRAATCDTDGYHAYEKCINGNCDYTTFEVIPALGHSLKYYSDVLPTCTTAGYTDKVECTRDGCTYAKETKVASLGHARQIVEGKAATCTQDGYYPYEICTRAGCTGEGLATKVVIEALGHDDIKYDGKAPTCTEFGWSAYTICQRCQRSTYSELPAKGHSYENGYCACGHSDPGQHTHVWNDGEVLVEATCLESGSMKYTCTDSHCGDTETRSIPALGHDNVHYDAKAATCTAEGWYEYDQCKRCGYSTIIKIPVTEHNYVGALTTAPTCSISGVRTFTCSCGKYYTVDVEKLGHDWGNWYIAKDATCDTNGQEQRICYNDSNHVDIRTIPKTGHDWSEWVVLVYPSCIAKGQERRICNHNSAHAEIRDIPTLDHVVNTTTGICSSCKHPIGDRLATPENLIVNGETIYWDTVEGADHYEVVINGNIVETWSTSLLLTPYYGTNFDLQIRIRAIAPSGSGIYNSAYNEYLFDIPTSPISAYDGLGQSVNLLTGGYTTTASGTTSIFNEALFNRLRVKNDTYKDSYTKIIYSESLHGYVNDVSNKFGNKLGIDVSVDYMKLVKVTAGFDFEVNEEYKEKSQSETKTIFYDMDYYYTNERVEIEGYKDTKKFTEALSEEFLADALKVQNGTMLPEEFINKYGTHIVTAGIYGGTFNLHYEMISKKTTVETTFTEDSKVGVSAGIGACIYGVNLGLDVKVENTAASSNYVSNTNADTQTKFEARTRGGDATGNVCTSLDDFKVVCAAWAETLDTTNDFVLIDVADNSLYFVWNFLPDEYQGAKDILNQYFKLACDDQYNSLIDKIANLYNDSFIFDEVDGTLLIDIAALQSHNDVTLSNLKYTMKDGKVLFDGTDGTGIFTIYRKFNGHDVHKVIFRGNYRVDDEGGVPYNGKFAPLTIKFDENWNRDITIEFENFAFKAPDGKPALDFSSITTKGLNINLIMTGHVLMIGGENSVGIDATGQKLVISGNSYLEIIGGKGSDGASSGANGNDGAIGIKADSIEFISTGEVNVTGGEGGNGHVGKTGTHTSNAGKGGDGGNGGTALSAQSVTFNNSDAKISVVGGNGGNGGNGGYIPNGSNNGGMYDIADAGNGGNGGNGGLPVDITALKKINCASLMLKHGNGGNGGDGGKGGDPAVLDNDYDPDQKSAGGHGGNGGNGFVAGNGGNGGIGGGSYGTDRWNTSPLLGVSGNGGNGGNGGNIIYGVMYSANGVEKLITTEECGKHGSLGTCGPILDSGEKNQGKSGSNGKDGVDGTTDGSYYSEFASIIK